ncbi:DUF6897 domain-containing protein [Undibacterium sp. Di27W]|uniref:DUF6897 domain-containing protein n=1 Tax=Undibacterium sp. Di27W TaxID=3413036 RepID=UPI003BF3DC94
MNSQIQAILDAINDKPNFKDRDVNIYLKNGTEIEGTLQENADATITIVTNGSYHHYIQTDEIIGVRTFGDYMSEEK